MISSLRKRPERSAARAALAECITIAKAADEALTNHRAAIDRATGAVQAVRSRLEEATARAGAAREAQTHALVLAASNGTAAPERTELRTTRHAVLVAQDDADLAEAALKRLEADLPAIEYAATSARQAVRAAACEVLRDEAPVARLLGEVRDLERQYLEKRAVLGFAYDAGFVTDAALFDQVQSLVTRPVPVHSWALFGFNGPRREPDWSGDAPAAWRAAFEALQVDPDAELPR